eukprot:s1162_g4.t1
MQRFTAYIIEINDFGKVTEVAHRYSDFETLHKALLMENPQLQLPPLPPKGADGTDAAVIAARKVELEQLLRGMLGNVEVLMERSLHFWKFLELGNPTVIAGRFVMAPRARPSVFKTLAKLNDEKYRDDVYRLGHVAVTDLLIEGLREMRKGVDSGHWSCAAGGRLPLCQLVAGALGTTQAARERLIDAGVINLLLGLVQNEESALDDVRPALNVIVAREGERLASFIARFLTTGGLLQLLDLVQRQRCQEFVAKLLWYSWDAGTRSAFAQPGGVGLKVLQTLLRSTSTSCSLLAAVLLGAMVAAGDFQDGSHRQEALKLVKGTLDRPEAAKDPQFAKVLMGGSSSLIRLAAMLEDVDLAPLVLGLLCTSKPAANKLEQISGNLASLISNKGAAHSEPTRALAAELLLHIQGSAPEVGNDITHAPVKPKAGQLSELLERCEGIAAHEESMEAALRTQLEEGINRGLKALEPHGVHVREARQMATGRLKDGGLTFWVMVRLQYSFLGPCRPSHGSMLQLRPVDPPVATTGAGHVATNGHAVSNGHAVPVNGHGVPGATGHHATRDGRSRKKVPSASIKGLLEAQQWGAALYVLENPSMKSAERLQACNGCISACGRASFWTQAMWLMNGMKARVPPNT